MGKNTLNFWLDVVFFIVLLGLIMTGGILYFVLPPGSGRSLALYGLGRHDLGAIHGYLAVAAIGLLIAHLFLHWSWIVCVVGRAFGKAKPSRSSSFMTGLLLFVSVVSALVGAIFWASSKVTPQSTPLIQNADRGHKRPRAVANVDPNRHDSRDDGVTTKSRLDRREGRRRRPTALLVDKHDEECAAGKEINGRTSLKRMADLAGATVNEARLFLALPRDVDSDERLGRLRRVYGFSIYDVRQWACRKSESD